MLDKSIRFERILMKRKAGVYIPEIKLPEGYRYVFFKPGDEKDWARIEASVLEFDSELEALMYFQKEFMPFGDELGKRCIFIEDRHGDKAATAMAWRGAFYPGGKTYPWLHWVAVKPDEQGNGLGKAISSKASRLLLEINGDTDFYLSTQTWSHRAVGIYEKLGWEMTYMKNIRHYSHVNYEKAKKVLRRIK